MVRRRLSRRALSDSLRRVFDGFARNRASEGRFITALFCVRPLLCVRPLQEQDRTPR